MFLAGKKVAGVLALGFLVMGAAVGAHTTPAQAATTTTLVTGATAPRGGLVLQGTAIDPATGKPVTHYWTPDLLDGLCRVDVNPATGAGTMNRNTCVLFLGGKPIDATQLSYDPVNHFIYMPDMSSASQGVWRLRYLPSADNGNGAISIFERTLLAPGCGVGLNLPWASALGPDGNLYLGFKSSGNIVRITNPAGSPTCSDVQVIGTSADGRISFALAFMGNNLWEGDGRGLGVIANAPACTTGTCHGVGVLPGTPALVNALASDPVNQVLYVGDPSNVYALNLAGGGASISTYATGFSSVVGLAVDPNTLSAGQLPVIYAGDDSLQGVPPGLGRIFRITPLTVSFSAQPPAVSNNPNPTFAFAANEPGVTFQCALDTAAPAACTSPQSFTALPNGAHAFKVQATHAAGGTATVSANFTIDTTAPVVSITGKPANPTNNVNPSFTFAANKAGSTFQCALDGAALAPCTSQQGYAGLANGSHTFKVVAADPAGNSSAAATYTFVVDMVAPSTPAGLTARAASVSEIDLSWTAATDNVSVAGYKVFRDGGTTPIGIVTSGTTFSDTGLAPSSIHSYTVVAVDAAGNVSARSVAASATTLRPPATATPTARPALTATPTPHREKLTVTVRVRGGIIRHGAPVVVRVHTRPGADARITLRLTRQGTRCSGAARQRVCARVTVVLAQRVVHARANRQGLVTWSVALGYSPASAVRATLGVRVSTPYGAVTHAAVVRLQPASRAR